ncbi:MAG: hypothetical protein F6J90_00860 [Moorea sp. SIOASIH]|nr:hypothetical protein [Moorena sp. SIOASIH]
MESLVELASSQFHAYFPAGRMPTLLLFIQRLTQRPLYYIDNNPRRSFDNFSSLLPTPYSLFPLLYKVP